MIYQLRSSISFSKYSQLTTQLRHHLTPPRSSLHAFMKTEMTKGHIVLRPYLVCFGLLPLVKEIRLFLCMHSDKVVECRLKTLITSFELGLQSKHAQLPS